MSLHKLTAGDGYTYLTRQVAARDAKQRRQQQFGVLADWFTSMTSASGTRVAAARAPR